MDRLSGYKPGVAIDALKDDIRMRERNANEIIGEINHTINFLFMTKE